jgi:group I intron endonuclease
LLKFGYICNMAYVNKICGIYKISLKGCDKVYIGLTNNFAQRKKEHIKSLKGNKHFNIYLQRAFVKYGEEGFLMEILEECALCDLKERERHYILKFDSFNNGFNLTTGGERFFMSEDVKKRISEKHKGKVVKESTRQKLREINLGKKMSQEVKDKLSYLNKNRIFTDEQKEKISKAAKFERTPEMRQRQSSFMMGKSLSEEAKLKLAAFNLKRVRPNSVIEILDGKVYIDGFEYIKGKRTPLEQEVFLVAKSIRMKEARRKASISNKGKKRSQETKDKISRGNKGLKRTTEQNIANSERQKGKKQSEDFKQKLRDYNTKKRQQKWDESQH